MKLSKKAHKILFFNLFYEVVNGQTKVKEYPLEELFDASSTKKKLAQKSDEADSKTIFNFTDDEVEFTPAEIVILKKLFDGKKGWNVDDAEAVGEIKELFNPISK